MGLSHPTSRPCSHVQSHAPLSKIRRGPHVDACCILRPRRCGNLGTHAQSIWRSRRAPGIPLKCLAHECRVAAARRISRPSSHTASHAPAHTPHLTPVAARAGMYGFPFLLLTLQVQVISRPARQRHLTLEWAGRISRPTLQPPKWWGRSPNLLTSSWDRRCRRCRSWSCPACAG